MSDGALPFVLIFFANWVLLGTRFLFEFIKSNVSLLVSFLSSWGAHAFLERNEILEHLPVTPLFLDCATFLVINVVVSCILKANSPLMQVTCSIFQLEISRLIILGATPNLHDYIESGAYIFILATIGSAFLAKWIMRHFIRVVTLQAARG
jgi:hypothetical protein